MTKVTCGCKDTQDKAIHNNKIGRMLAIPGRYSLKNKVSSERHIHINVTIDIYFCEEKVTLRLSR